MAIMRPCRRVMLLDGAYFRPATSTVFLTRDIKDVCCEMKPTATVEIGVLQLQVRSCGTAFQLLCDKPAYFFRNFA